MNLSKLVSEEVKIAFNHMVKDVSEKDFYGFAIYTDDSAEGVDIAANTMGRLAEIASKGRASRYKLFSNKWYATEWEYVGGYAVHFPKSDEEIQRILEDKGEEAARLEVYQAMIEALKILTDEAFFDSITDCDNTIVLIIIVDSGDNEEFMIRSIQELNPTAVYQEFLVEKEAAGE